MRKFYHLFILFFFSGLATASFAQDGRYISEIFAEVDVETDVEYGVNATILFISQAMELIPEELKCDIYTPKDDTLSERPLVLVYHTGNFLPPVTNGQIAGSKIDSNAVEFCMQLARRGYTAVSVDYRLGWNPLALTQPERALGLIQAAYRGVQDANTCVRFFRKTHAEDGNPYGIDPDLITAFGIGTGGYISLAQAGLDDYNEILMTTNAPFKFWLDVDGNGTPETPMVVEAYHGDIEGKVLTISPDTAFGFPAGDTSNYPNHTGYDSDIQFVTNVGGALGDISWFDDVTIPSVTIQSAYDMFAPYEDGVLTVPTTGDPIAQVQGALLIGQAQQTNNNNDVFIDANLMDDFTQKAKDNSATAGHAYYEGVYPFTNPPNGNMLDEGIVTNWWNPDAPAPGAGMGIPWSLLPHPLGGTFHTQGLLTNEGMSEAKARANIELVLGYWGPRACLALGLEECIAEITTSVNEVPSQALLEVAPNPASNYVQIETDRPFSSIEVYSFNGQQVALHNGLNQQVYNLDVQSLQSGLYILKVYFEDGVITKKIALR